MKKVIQDKMEVINNLSNIYRLLDMMIERQIGKMTNAQIMMLHEATDKIDRLLKILYLELSEDIKDKEV